MMAPPRPHHAPMPRALVALVGVIALIEVVLSLADAGIVFDPSLRGRVFMAGAFWAACCTATRRSLPRSRPPCSSATPSCTDRCCTW